MRVIAGEYKGRKLASPGGTDVRPTPDRIKEAIFSMVLPELEGAVCMDLFAGSGALGIEALSRGAARVYFCDNSSASLAIIKKNLDMCKADGSRAVVFANDWRGAAVRLAEKCNLVFIDAPYDMCEYYSEMLETLAGKNLLEDGALLVVERAVSAGDYVLPAMIERIREKRYGNIGVDLLLFSESGEGR